MSDTRTSPDELRRMRREIAHTQRRLAEALELIDRDPPTEFSGAVTHQVLMQLDWAHNALEAARRIARDEAAKNR